MSERDERTKRIVFLCVATGAACFLCYVISRPFATPILAAVILAVLFNPLFLRLKSITGNRNWAAFLSLTILLVLLGGLTALMVFVARREIVFTYGWLKTNTTARDGWTTAFSSWTDRAAGWIGVKTGVSPEVVRHAALTRIDQASATIVKKTGDTLAGVGNLSVAVVLTFVAFFFFLREGRRFVDWITWLMPLQNEEKTRFLENVQSSIEANVVGVLVVAVVQAALLGIGFWVLSVPSPLLWALVTAGCSLIPFFGAALVWIPGAVYLFLAGSWVKALILVGWGAGIVSLSDNIVRPWVISERLKLPSIVLLFAMLGGVEVFGPLGIFVGPMVFSIARLLARMLQSELKS
ncbi:MAG: AI-2E family transporter [Acidobacteriaceae bacterium]|nr:AI-2E family transporter [Acidobacteriaceae bacterium]